MPSNGGDTGRSKRSWQHPAVFNFRNTREDQTENQDSLSDNSKEYGQDSKDRKTNKKEE